MIVGYVSQKSPLVTVAMSTYNALPYLKDSITSILGQSYRNLQIIVIDDGSADDTEKMMHNVSDSRLTFISDKRNIGLAERLNQTISLARGKYYCRMDADDIMSVDRISKQVEYLENHSSVDVLGSGAYIMDIRNQIVGQTRSSNGAKLTLVDVLNSRSLFVHPSICGKVEWFKKNLYNPAYTRSEDIELWIRTIDQSNFAILEERLIFYREHGLKLCKKSARTYAEMASWVGSYAEECFGTTGASAYVRKLQRLAWLYRMGDMLGLDRLLIYKRRKMLSIKDSSQGETALREALCRTPESVCGLL